MFGGTLKDKITNAISLLMAILSAVQVYIGTLGGGKINYFTLALTVLGAIVAWFTGKSGDGKVKKPV